MGITATKRGTRLIAFILAIMALLPILTMGASAANVCKTVSGSAKTTKTFTIKTGSRWLGSDKVTLTQAKGKMGYYSWWSGGAYKTKNIYDCYTVTYYNKTKNISKTTTWTGKTLTLKLDRNCTYEITVKEDWAQLTIKYLKTGSLEDWEKFPTWTVKSTKGILSCG